MQMPLVGSANLELLLHIWPSAHRTAMHEFIGVWILHHVSHMVCPVWLRNTVAYAGTWNDNFAIAPKT